MKHKYVIFRLFFGLTFVLSGFVKMVDPVGTGLVVQEYINVVHLDFLSIMSVPFGILLSLLEFITGVAILMRMRMREASVCALLLTLFFTIVSVFLLIFDPIQDCGCFGEAAYLTHGETFFKNILLLICIVPIFLHRKKFRRDSSSFVEWLFLSIYAMMVLLLGVISYVRMPVIEYGDFKTGTDIAVKLTEAEEGIEFTVSFIYEKDGERGEFFLDNLPDTSWTYVETIEKSDYDDKIPFDFHVTNETGEYISDTLIVAEKPLLMCSIYDLEKYYTPKRWQALNEAKSAMEEKGGELWILVASTPEQVKEILGENVPENYEIGYTDYKTAIAVHRSNGGYLYFNSAFIVRKWSRQGFSPEDDLYVVDKDFDLVMINDIIKQQLVHEVSIVVILISIAIIRYFCKVVAMRRIRKSRESENQEEL